MQAIEVEGMIDEHSRLRLAEPLPLTGPSRVRVIILVGESPEPSETDWLRAASNNPAYAFLQEPAEDIYKPTDGTPYHGQG